MPITDVVPDYTGVSLDTEVDIIANRGTMTAKYDVAFSPADPPELEPPTLRAVMAAEHPDVPAYWAPLSDAHPFWYVKHKSAKPSNGAFNWQVTVEYEYYDNPLAARPKVTWTRGRTSEPIDREVDGKPILMSSDEPVDPPLMEEYSFRILKIEKNVSLTLYDDEVLRGFIGSINSVQWQPLLLADATSVPNEPPKYHFFAPYIVKCEDISGTPERVGNTWFVHVTFEFHVHDDQIVIDTDDWLGWRRRVLDIGFREVSSVGQDGSVEYAEIRDKNDNPMTHPVKLDGSGKKLADGADPVWKIFNTKKLKDFNELGL
jgi:hypothetical protein